MSFDIALSGINAINTELETVSNNIANSGTYGFKSSRANFSSMYAGSQPVGTRVGSLTQSIDQGGSVLSTGRNMDASIDGRGFFATRNSDGTMLYTRVGIFSTDKDGYVIDSFGHNVQGYAAIDNTTTLGALGDLKVQTGQIAAQATDKLSYIGNLSSDWTTPTTAIFDPTDATSYNSSQVSVVYDSLGSKHTLTQYFVHTGTNQVTTYYSFDGTLQGTSQVLDFGTDGAMTSPVAPVSLAIAPAPTGANALTVAIDYTGTTQYAGDASTTTNAANGYASGVMTGVSIEKDGAVMAQYSNGQKKSVGTLAIATFPNEDGLIPVSDTAWTTSNDSGTALYSTPGVGTAGSLSVGALEQSNVDVASELVNLMSAQRNYQANTKVISTENEMMQSLMQAV